MNLYMYECLTVCLFKSVLTKDLTPNSFLIFGSESHCLHILEDIVDGSLRRHIVTYQNSKYVVEFFKSTVVLFEFFAFSVV